MDWNEQRATLQANDASTSRAERRRAFQRKACPLRKVGRTLDRPVYGAYMRHYDNHGGTSPRRMAINVAKATKAGASA
jgi:hypothetical protein